MYPFKRILIALDQTATDKTLIRFAAYLYSRLTIDKIYFVHVAKTLEWPPEIVEKYPDILAPVDENIQHEIQDQISKHLPAEAINNSEIIVREGNAAQVILREVIIKKTDLLVMGNKLETQGTGRLTRKMANLAHCSIALISDSFLEVIDSKLKIMVSVDFNDSSIKALESALYLYNEKIDQKIIVNHVFHVPSGYHYSGKHHEEFAEIMKDNAAKKMEKLLKKENINSNNSTQVLTLDPDNNIARKINEIAENERVHLIVLGSKGRTGAASFLLGSTAEKLIGYSSKSIMIIKDKKHNMDLLDALMQV